MSKAIIKAFEERQRQINEEDFDATHDDHYKIGQLSAAASCYALAAEDCVLDLEHEEACSSWPWHEDWWKPSSDPKRNIVKAMALLAAEYDRLERAEAAAKASESASETLWSTDDEWQSGMWNDLQDLIADRELQAGDTVYMGSKRHAQATDFTINLDESVIENIQVQAEDDSGEMAEDYPNPSEPQIQALQALIDSWATTYCDPGWYSVVNVQPYTITDEDVEAIQ